MFDMLLLLSRKLTGGGDLYISSILIAITLVSGAVRLGYKDRRETIFATAGRRYSLYMYVFHILVKGFVKKGLTAVGIAEYAQVYCILAPVMVFTGTMIVSIGYGYFINEMKGFNSERG